MNFKIQSFLGSWQAILLVFLILVFGLLELFGIGFLIVIVTSILNNENQLCQSSNFIFDLTGICNPSLDFNFYGLIILFFVIKLLAQSFIISFRTYYLNNQLSNFLKDNFSKILSLKQDHKDQISFFDMNTILLNNFDALYNAFFDKIFDLITELLILFLLLSLLFFTIPDNKLIIICAILVLAFIYIILLNKKTKSKGIDRNESLIKLNSVFYNIFLNSKIYEIFSNNQYIQNKINKFIILFTKTNIYSFLIIKLPKIILENILIILILIIVIISVSTLGKDQTSFIFSIYGVIFIRIFPSITRIKTSYDNGLFRYPLYLKAIEIKEKVDQLKSQDTSTIFIDEFNEISINNLNLSYDNDFVLKDVSFKIKKGDFVLIKGETGSGKSTFLNFLSGFKSSRNFGISIDGKNQILDKNSVYLSFNNISYLPQSFNFEEETLLNNITLGVNNDDKTRDIKKYFADLSLDKYINKLDNHINFDGTNLSQGEMQRFSLVRALINKPKILILDEPFSAVDTNTQKLMINLLTSYKNKITLIATSHIVDIPDFFDKTISF